MATTNKKEEQIFIGNDDIVVELLGEAKAEFIAERNKINAELAKLRAEQQAKEEARKSALSKLKALGLTDDEISALVS